MSTIFTKIINKEIPAEIVYEDTKSLAFIDINAQAPTHILIIPKEEIISLDEVSEKDKELLGHLLVVANKIAKKLKVNKTGYRIVCNCNADAGQTVYHLHFHLLGGRKLLWPPG